LHLWGRSLPLHDPSRLWRYHLMHAMNLRPPKPIGLDLFKRLCLQVQQNERAMELARIISRNAPLGIQVTKEAGRKFIEAGEQAAIAVVPKIRERVMNSEDAKEGIKSFVERRTAVFTGR